MKKDIKNYWDNRASSYSELISGELNSFKRDAWKNVIKDAIGNRKYTSVLDVGTGPGFFSIIMSELGYKVCALDSSDEMLSMARDNAHIAGYDDIEFLNLDADFMKLEDESFDIIISRNVTWTLKNPQSTYEKWFNLLKKGGMLIIFDANWYNRIGNDDVRKEYEEDMKVAIKMGYDCKATESQNKSCENLAKSLPMTYNDRPSWDDTILNKIGFESVKINDDVGSSVYAENEKVAYHSTPLFGVYAIK